MKKSTSLLLFVACTFICTAQPTYQIQTINALELYKKAVLLPQSAESLLKPFYYNKGLYGKKSFKRNKPMRTAALNIVKNQVENLALVSEPTRNKFQQLFKNNCCNCGAGQTIVFVRKVLQPQTTYSYLATPFRNECYVFYALTDFDSATGFGRYFQTDAFYPRDAFSFASDDLCPKCCSATNRIEFFTGVFYLTHSSLLRDDIVALLSPQNNFNDRKEFLIDTKNDKLILTKAFEFKMYNFYPNIGNNYTLEQKDAIDCNGGNTHSIFKTEYSFYEKLIGDEASNAMYQLKSRDTTYSGEKQTKEVYRDYTYPLKGDSLDTANAGYVFFGFQSEGNKIIDETFYRYKPVVGFNNQEITTIEQLEKIKNKKNRRVKPFDIIKVRSEPRITTSKRISNFNDPSIIGEAFPEFYYQVDSIIKSPAKNANDNLIWIKIKLAEK